MDSSTARLCNNTGVEGRALFVVQPLAGTLPLSAGRGNWKGDGGSCPGKYLGQIK